jgi:hypothetical protein
MKNILVLILTLFAIGQISAQCIVLQNCQSSSQACDLTANNSNLWNETYWNDPSNQTSDLADTPVEINLSVLDTCDGATLTVRYLLYLDLDKDGTWETVVKSWEPPAPGTVNYNNWDNPNFNGGDPRVFDERPVTASDKYQFAVETQVNGDTTLAYLRWNTPSAPGVFVNTELPYATHKIKWLLGDDLGNNTACEYPIIVKDCKKPTVVCLNGISVNIMPTEQITLWASDFLQYAEDNATPTSLLVYGIRKCGSGSGFPLNPDGSPQLSVTFTCSELGTQCVELWAKDIAGNMDYCETYALVQDNMNHCDGGGSGTEIPTVVCHNGLSVNIMPSGQIQLWATDFLLYATDDETPFNQLEFGIRKAGSGIDFPVDGNDNPIQNLIYSCTELGTQTVEIWARDEDGNADYCQSYVIVQDNFGNCPGGGPSDAPVIVCLNGLSVNLMPTGQVDLWTSDFIQYAQDDNTPFNQLIFSIRKSGTGSGFPLDGNSLPIEKLSFDCDELGAQLVEVWVKDLDGNADYCETYVFIKDLMEVCDGNQVFITTCISNPCNDAPIQGANLLVNGSFVDAIGPVDADGCGIFDVSANVNGNFTVAPSFDYYPNNGVTVLDLIKIKRFILGLDTDNSPYTQIAADVNKSGTITGFDIIEIRKLILGINTEFPNNSSWRFVDANFVFPNPNNPFQTAFPETITIPNAVAGANYEASFKAIKIGDLDCDAWPGLQAPNQERGLPKQTLTLPDAALQAGETTELSLQMNETGDWTGLQLGLQFDPSQVEILAVQGGAVKGLDASAFHQPNAGALHFVWASEQAEHLEAGKTLFTLRVRALKTLHVSEVFRTTTNFENLGSLGDAPQTLALEFRADNNSITLGTSTIFAPQPNPTSEGSNIPVWLAQSEKVRVEISDLSGKTLWVNELQLNSGSHTIQIAPQSMPQTGVYVWRVSAGNTTASGKLVKI